MLTYGTAIDQSNDPLHKTDIDTIANKIVNPKPEFISRIAQLRQVKIMDEKQYRRLKVKLPYFCCGIFSPCYRRKENFAAIQWFTLDFDHFSGKNVSREDVVERLKEDCHIRLLFTTPGGDGLKAILGLNEVCCDAGRYTHFYKTFAQIFSKKYELDKVTDWVTHDVTRASFFSADPEAWQNPAALPIKMCDFVDETAQIGYQRIEDRFEQLAKENLSDRMSSKEGSPADETLTLIKSKLRPNYRPKMAKNVFTPNEIGESMPLIEDALEKAGIKIVSVCSIHFGKQVRVQLDRYWAEINVFYGKRGFSVVRTTKTGSNEELAEVAYQIVDCVLN